MLIAQRCQPGVELTGHGEQACCPLCDDDALRGERGSAGRPGHQADPGPRLRGPDPGGHGLLGNTDLTCGGVQAPGVGDCDQHL